MKISDYTKDPRATLSERMCPYCLHFGNWYQWSRRAVKCAGCMKVVTIRELLEEHCDGPEEEARKEAVKAALSGSVEDA